MMKTNFNLQDIIPELLSNVPELEKAYMERLEEEKSDAETLSMEDIRQLEQISQIHNLGDFDVFKPGVTIVFEQLLAKFIIELSQDSQLHKRLESIMKWIETLAEHQEFAVRNLIAVSVCEPFITKYEVHLERIVPLMGDQTKALCTMQFKQFQISAKTKALFGIV